MPEINRIVSQLVQQGWQFRPGRKHGRLYAPLGGWGADSARHPERPQGVAELQAGCKKARATHQPQPINSTDTRMKRKIAPQDNAGNIVNPNHGTSGTNLQYDQNQGNWGEQLNPNRSVSASGEPSYESESDLLSNLIKKHFGTPTTAPVAPVSSAPTEEDDDIDQGDVYYYDGCGD